MIRADRTIWEWRWLNTRAFVKLVGLICDTTFRAMERCLPRPLAAVVILWILFDFWLVWRLT